MQKKYSLNLKVIRLTLILKKVLFKVVLYDLLIYLMKSLNFIRFRFNLENDCKKDVCAILKVIYGHLSKVENFIFYVF